MKFTGTLLNLDGILDSQWNRFDTKTKIELPERVPVIVNFDKTSMENSQGVHKLLGVQSTRQQVANKSLCKGRCQVKGCEEMAVKVVSFISGNILSLYIKHLKIKNIEPNVTTQYAGEVTMVKQLWWCDFCGTAVRKSHICALAVKSVVKPAAQQTGEVKR